MWMGGGYVLVLSPKKCVCVRDTSKGSGRYSPKNANGLNDTCFIYFWDERRKKAHSILFFSEHIGEKARFENNVLRSSSRHQREDKKGRVFLSWSRNRNNWICLRRKFQNFLTQKRPWKINAVQVMRMLVFYQQYLKPLCFFKALY